MLCIGGICIPYSVLWPLVVIFFREIWKFFGGKVKSTPTNEAMIENKKAEGESAVRAGGHLGYLRPDMKFDSLIKPSKPLFAKFTAKWCKPCKEIDPFVEELAKRFVDSATFINIDVDEFDELAATYGAIKIPHMVCFKSGKNVEYITGKDTGRIEAFVKKNVEN